MHTWRSLVLVAVLALMLAFALVGGMTPVQAQDLPPRPTEAPHAPPRPTEVPVSSSSESHTTHATETPALGRITGTVIDAATNAPAPNIVIHVNDLTVTTDSNGNYDALDLVNGTYRVSLVLPVGRSDAPQPVDVQLAAGATVFQHLRFGSVPPPTPATAPAQPTVLPATGDGSPFPTLVLLLAGLLVLMGVGLRLRPPTNE